MQETRSRKDIWNARLYDGKHSFVSKFGNDLIDLLAPRQGENILDLGCGTGDLAHKLAELGAKVVGIDQSENMVAQAKKKYPHIPFFVVDANKLNFDKEFDAVFSNATLHWIKTPMKVLSGILTSLKPDGRFVAEFGGKGNVKFITDEITHQCQTVGLKYESENFPWYFPSIGEYAGLMEEVGFRVILAEHFDRPTPLDGENGLRNWIKMFASQLLEGISLDTQELIFTNVENNLKETLFINGTWVADYKRIRVIGQK